MRQSELDALIEQGVDALRAARGLSGEEQQIVARAIARLEAGQADAEDAPAEEPVSNDADSEQEPKAAEGRRSNPRVGAGRKVT